MVDYANVQCSDCHGIFSGQTMKHRNITNVAGSSVTPIRNGDGRVTSYDTTTHYENRDIVICKSCSSRRTRNKIIKLFLISALMVTGFSSFVYLQSNRKSSTQPDIINGEGSSQFGNQTSAADSDSQSVRTDEFSENGGGSLVNAPVEPDPSTTEKVDPRESQSEATTSPAPQARSSQSFTPENTPEIATSIAAAFAAGKPTRWKAEGYAGYAVPSEPDPRSGCRNIFYTVDSGGEPFQSPSQKLCP